jgi:hypothetical protein
VCYVPGPSYPSWFDHSNNTRAMRKVTSGEMLTKQATSKKLLYTNNTYILKLLLNVVTAGIETLFILGNKFLYAGHIVTRFLETRTNTR